MPARLALVSAKLATEGPWTIAKGNESKIEIFGLGQAESVRLELESSTGHKALEYSSNGLHAWPDLRVDRYRVCKLVGDETLVPCPTTVRIMLSSQRTEAVK